MSFAPVVQFVVARYWPSHPDAIFYLTHELNSGGKKNWLKIVWHKKFPKPHQSDLENIRVRHFRKLVRIVINMEYNLINGMNKTLGA
jgi:hypothetical protein